VNHNEWDWELLVKKEIDGVPVSVYHSKIPGRRRWTSIGIDPGRNFGICTLDGRYATVMSGQLPKESKQWRYGIAAFNWARNPRNYHGKGPAVVEGAAYGKSKGQADLAHTRMGFVLGLLDAGHNVDIIPPASIRLQAFGKGNMGGLEVWPDLNHNAGDAVAAALYAAGVTKEIVSGTHLDI
jgi:hypothetical protein